MSSSTPSYATSPPPEGFSRLPSCVAELRAIGQPPAVRGRRNAEHWTADVYLRRISPYLTMQFLRLGFSANQVTGVMILCGWCIAGALLIPGVVGAALALFMSQMQMLVDCCDGEIARWRQKFSPAGVFLDKVGHYTTETLVPIALGVRAAGLPFDPPAGYQWTTIGALLGCVIMLNKALNDIVHVSRASAGLAKLQDTREEAAPQSAGIAKLRGLAKYVPFHRLYHSVEMSIWAFLASLIGLVVGQDVANRVLVGALLPLSLLAVTGHFVSIMASRKLRS